MKEVVKFLKQRQNVKYSLWVIIFGLIFAFTFQANKTQIPQILEEPIELKIDLKTREGQKHLISGWKEERGLIWLAGRTATQKISQILPEKTLLLKPERIGEYYKLGKKYYKEGQYSKARREFQKEVILESEHKRAKRYLGKIKAKIGPEKERVKKILEKKAVFKKEALFKIFSPSKKTHRMVVKAFSCSPPDIREQRIEVHFNDVALDRLKFRKTPKWQKFSVNIPSYFIKETSTIKFVYTQDIHLSPIAFDSLEFKNYIFRIKGLYLLFDSPKQERINYLSPRVLSYSFGFAILFLLFWLFYSYFLFRLIGGPALRHHSFGASATGEAGPKMKFSRATRIDLLSYLPSVISLSLFALISFFSSYHFVYSLKAFFVLALAPTAVLKLLPYKDLSLHFVKIVFKFISRDIEKTCSEIKRAYSAFLSFLSFLKRQITTFRRFLIHYHKTNLSSAFILDFMLLLVLCATLLMFKTEWLAERIANLAYFLLVIGAVMKFIQHAQKEKTGNEKRFIRIKKRWKIPFKKIILGLVSILLVSLFLWLILPGKGVEVTQLIPQETFIFFSLKIDSEVPGTSDLINNFDWRIRWGARLLGPVEVVAFATPAVSKEEPDYLFLVKNNRLIKISRLLRRSIDKAMISEKPFKKSKYKTCQILCVERPRHPDNVCSYTLFRDIALFSNNPSLLKASLDQSGRETSFISGEALGDFRELQSSGETLFFINNSHSELSRTLKSLEGKSAYAILPTVDSLNYLGGYFDILDADSLKGSILFKYRETVDIKKGREDIYFLAGLLKRLSRANGLNFEEEIIIMDNHYLKLNFKLSGLKAVINNFLAKKKK